MSSVFDAINTQNDVSDEKRAEVLSEFPTPKGGTKQEDGDARQHTDADSIRRHFGITEWDRSRFDWPSVFPNCMDHQWDAPVEELSGGTDVFARGKPGSGKSTLLNYLSARLMDINEETVVWRGSTSRSEWLPLAPWTTLCLPEGVEVDARLESRKKSEPSVPLDVDDLEEIVRDVQRYSDPIDLNHRVLEPGGFHVVFPDPELRGCAEIYRADDDTPAKRDNLFSEEDPATHWWFGWFLGRVNHGPHHWTTLVLDEIGDVVPQDAQKDQFGTYQKVDLMKDAWVDARKHGLSVSVRDTVRRTSTRRSVTNCAGVSRCRIRRTPFGRDRWSASSRWRWTTTSRRRWTSGSR
jgi:energy-coupling factor transporter ATP-binding protein EcfA2